MSLFSALFGEKKPAKKAATKTTKASTKKAKPKQKLLGKPATFVGNDDIMPKGCRGRAYKHGFSWQFIPSNKKLWDSKDAHLGTFAGYCVKYSELRF